MAICHPRTLTAKKAVNGYFVSALRARTRIGALSKTLRRMVEWNELFQLSNCLFSIAADGVGFEPTKGLHPCRISSPVHSTALPPIRLIPLLWHKAALS